MPQLSLSRRVLPNSQHTKEITAVGDKLGGVGGGQEGTCPRDEGGNGGFKTLISRPQVALAPKDSLRPPPQHSPLSIQPRSRAEALSSHHLRGKGWNSRTFCFPENAQVKFQGQKLALGLGKKILPNGVNGEWGGVGWGGQELEL